VIAAQTALIAAPQGARRPWPVRLYVALERFQRQVSRAGSAFAERCAHLVMAVYRGLWLGVLDRDDLVAITQIAYDDAAPRSRWDELRYVDSGLHGWEKDFVTRLSRESRVLVGCAGAGREAFALAREGFAVTGFDCSTTLVDSAHARSAADRASVCFVRSAPDEAPQLGTFDAAIVGWGGYIHIIGRERRIAFLRDIRRQLVAGAPLLVSFLTRPPVSRRFKIAKALADFVRRLRSHEPIELGDELTHVGTFAHCFTQDEIVAELEAAGFAFDRFGAKDTGDVKDGYVVGIASPEIAG